MKSRCVWLVVLTMILSLSITAWGQGRATPETTGALDKLKEALRSCFEFVKVDLYTGPEIPGDKYAIFYSDDPDVDRVVHDFGWYSADVGCGALYRIVNGPYWDGRKCQFVPSTESHHILPCAAALGVALAPGTAFGFWLNAATAPTGASASLGGNYFTRQALNWDGLRHAYIYQAEYFLRDMCKRDSAEARGDTCRCTCCEMIPEGIMYLIFWEDGCAAHGDIDWDDFMVALVPCKR